MQMPFQYFLKTFQTQVTALLLIRKPDIRTHDATAVLHTSLSSISALFSYAGTSLENVKGFINPDAVAQLTPFNISLATVLSGAVTTVDVEGMPYEIHLEQDALHSLGFQVYGTPYITAFLQNTSFWIHKIRAQGATAFSNIQQLLFEFSTSSQGASMSHDPDTSFMYSSSTENPVQELLSQICKYYPAKLLLDGAVHSFPFDVTDTISWDVTVNYDNEVSEITNLPVQPRIYQIQLRFTA